jgi:hypothetical protein
MTMYNGTVHVLLSITAGTFAIEASFDGGGSALVADAYLTIEIPCDCTLQRVTMIADVSGSVGIWIGYCTYANYIAFPSGDFTSLSGATFPTPSLSISSAVKNQNTSLGGWTTSLIAGDILGFIIPANATTIDRLTVSLVCSR